MTRIAFTDAEQRFADSAEGRAKIAHARMVHDMSFGYPSNGEHPFTDEQAAQVIRDAIVSRREMEQQIADITARNRLWKALDDAAGAKRA